MHFAPPSPPGPQPPPRAKGPDPNRPDRTRWVSRNVFELTGFMRVVGLLFGRSFRKQSQAFMEEFKAFAEKGTDVRG